MVTVPLNPPAVALGFHPANGSSGYCTAAVSLNDVGWADAVGPWMWPALALPVRSVNPLALPQATLMVSTFVAVLNVMPGPVSPPEPGVTGGGMSVWFEP